jgi:hypothetical protein
MAARRQEACLSLFRTVPVGIGHVPMEVGLPLPVGIGHVQKEMGLPLGHPLRYVARSTIICILPICILFAFLQPIGSKK